MIERETDLQPRLAAARSRQPAARPGRDPVGMLQADVLAAAAAAFSIIGAFAAADASRAAGGLIAMLVSAALCAAAVVIGWGLAIFSLLYVVAGYATAAWLLTALGIAVAHAVLALFLWRHAARLGRRLVQQAEPPAPRTLA